LRLDFGRLRRAIVPHANAGRRLERLEHHLTHRTCARATPAGDDNLSLVGARLLHVKEWSQRSKRARGAAAQNIAACDRPCSRAGCSPGSAIDGGTQWLVAKIGASSGDQLTRT